MLKNHLRTAWRRLRKDKGFSAINIFGLALGLAACIFITLFVRDELSYDRYNTKADRIFRVDADLRINGGTIEDIVTPTPMAAALKKDFPAVENAVRIRSDRREVVVHLGDKVFLEPGAVRADSTLFDILTLPLIVGDPHTALSSPNSLVLSATTAKRYFNTTDVRGRLMKLDNDTTPYMVTGVMRDIPAQSHIHFNLIKPLTRVSEDWINFFAATYILVRPGITTAQIDKMLAATVHRYVDPQIRDQLHTSAADLNRRGDHFRYYAMPLTRIHLYSNLEHEFETNGSIGYVVLFIVIAVLTLLIAAVNFVNLTTARSLRRLREIGVRKIMGSSRRHLAGQFLVESTLLTAFAMALALLFVLAFLPWFDRLTGKPFDASFLLSRWTLPSLALATVTIGILSGSYPAFLLSGVQPLKILRGELSVGFRTGMLRTALLVFQFSTAIILMIGTGVIYSQLAYIRHRDPGYTSEQVLAVKNTRPLGDRVWTFAGEARRLPGVINGTVSGSPFDQRLVFRGFLKDLSHTESATALLADWHVDADYLPTMKMKLVSGRNFSSQMPTDSGCALINETGARVLGFTDPLGKRIYNADDTDTAAGYRIIGVVKDFNVGSLRDPIDPMVFRLVDDGNVVLLRLSPGDIAGTLKSIRNAYKAVANGLPFVYSFLDDDFNRVYQADQRTASLFTVFSILAVIIAGLGMFALVAAVVEQRTRELGIRRVLGARLLNLAFLLLKDYGWTISLAILIALPVGAWTMHNWLDGFVYRTPLQPWIFISAPLVMIVLALLIVVTKTNQITRTDLADTLRTE